MEVIMIMNVTVYLSISIAILWVTKADAQSQGDARRYLWNEAFVEKLKTDPKKLLFIAEADRDPKRAKYVRNTDKYEMELPAKLAKDFGKGTGLIYELYKIYVKTPREKW